MERQEVLSLIRLELRKFAKPGEETSGFTADRIIMSDAGGTNGDTGLITSNAVFDGLATKHTTSATAEFTTVAAQSGTPWQVLTTNNVLAASRVMMTGSSGKINTSSITETELVYLNDCTSNVQTQLNTKAATANPTITGKLVVDSDADYNDPEPLASFLDDGAPTSREIAIGGLGMYRRDHDDVADLRMNFLGYNGGTTQFRNFDVYDGKSALALRVDGSNKKSCTSGGTPLGAPTCKASWIKSYQSSRPCRSSHRGTTPGGFPLPTSARSFAMVC